MKLKQYFETQKKIECTQEQKLFIYNKISNKIQKRSLFSYISFYKKVWIYFMITVFLLLTFYSSYIFETKPDYQIAKIWSWYIVQQKVQDNKTIVQATTIWKVIETIWGIKIIKNWIETPWNILSDWDNILLLTWAQMKFEVISWSQAFIKWPAQFSLKYVWDEQWRKMFVVNLIYWDYFEVLSNNTELNNLIVKTNDFEIESQKVTDSMNITITWQWDKKIIDNKWWDIVVKKITNNKKVFSSIKTNQKAQISEEVQIIQEVKYISKQVKEKQISQTYDITWINNSEVQTWIQTTVNFTTPQTSEILNDSKIVMDEKQLEDFKSLIYPWFLKKDIENLSISYLKWNQDSFRVSYENYLLRIKKIYKLLDLQFDSKIVEYNLENQTVTINDLVTITDQLYAKIDKWYYVPNTYLKRLKSVLWWLLLLKDSKFWQYSTQSIEFENILHIMWKETLSSQLIIE